MTRAVARWLWLAAACTAPGCGRPSPLQRIEIADPRAYWVDGGFAEMVPALRPPTSLDGRDRITTWLRVPDGEAIGVRRLDDGRAVVRYPRGTIADRVELRESVLSPDDQHAWDVLDVRGTRLDGDGAEQFHCLQPAGRGGELAGFAWPRNDADAERAAADGLVALARRRLADADDPAPQPAQTLRLARLRQLTRCEPCHDHGRRERTRIADGGPRRATDDAGFYSILGVLSDSGPLENHRPRELNTDDPFVSVSRPGGGAVPRAELDLPRALASGRSHERAVCRSRRYLFDHMDGEARRAFAQAFAECGIR